MEQLSLGGGGPVRVSDRAASALLKRLRTRPGMPWVFDLHGLERVVGTVERIAPSGAYVIVSDGSEQEWHVPVAFVRRVRPISVEDFAEIAVTDR